MNRARCLAPPPLPSLCAGAPREREDADGATRARHRRNEICVRARARVYLCVCVYAPRAPPVIDRRQYGCAKASLLLFVGRVTQAVAPASAHSCKVKPSARPLSSVRPHVRTSVRPSVRLSSPIIALARCTGRLLHFFVRPARQSGRVSIPRGTSRLQRYIWPAGILLSRLDIEILPNTIETPSTAMEITINEKGTDPAGAR